MTFRHTALAVKITIWGLVTRILNIAYQTYKAIGFVEHNIVLTTLFNLSSLGCNYLLKLFYAAQHFLHLPVFG